MQELQIVELAGAIELLEIEHRARSVVDDEEAFELVEEVAAKRGIGEQAFDSGLVDAAIGEVLYNRKDQRTVRRRVDHRAAVTVGQDVELVIGTGHRQPHRGEPVEIADVPLQRVGRAFIPRHVEADGERTSHRGCGGGWPARPDLPSARRSDAEQLPDRGVDSPLGAAEQRRLGRRARQTMFHRNRQRGLSRNHSDRGEQGRDCKDVQQYEQRHGELEPPPPATRWIVEDLTIGHHAGLIGDRLRRQ